MPSLVRKEWPPAAGDASRSTQSDSIVWAYRVVVFCGSAPLVVGVLTFLLWLVTRWTWLMVVGALTIGGGVFLVLVGSVALAWYGWSERPSSGASEGRWRMATYGCACLLLSNFPVAAVIVIAANAVETCYTVVVHNRCGEPLEHARVVGGGCNVDFGAIRPGMTVRRRFWIRHDGRLDFRATIGAAAQEKEIDGYVTGNIGGYVVVTVKADGSISAVNSRGEAYPDR